MARYSKLRTPLSRLWWNENETDDSKKSRKKREEREKKRSKRDDSKDEEGHSQRGEKRQEIVAELIAMIGHGVAEQ
jgi:hypothetical protein